MESRHREEYIESKITPELLGFFSRDEARALAKLFVGMEPHKYMKPIREILGKFKGSLYDYVRKKEDMQYLANEIRGRKVIEFGDKEGTNERFFLELGATSYEASDPVSYTEGLDIDGLTHLIRQPDESAIVCSFAILYSRILYNTVDYFFKGGDPDFLKKYRQELGRQIYRVTPNNGITLHMLEYDIDLINAGFAEERVLHDFAGLKSFRKK